MIIDYGQQQQISDGPTIVFVGVGLPRVQPIPEEQGIAGQATTGVVIQASINDQ